MVSDPVVIEANEDSHNELRDAVRHSALVLGHVGQKVDERVRVERKECTWERRGAR